MIYIIKHEFGIIDKISPTMSFESYEPEKYNCISIDDKFIEMYLSKFNSLDTYFHNLSHCEKGLNYTGITLIPSISLPEFKYIVDNLYFRGSETLSSLISISIKENKFIIHYGI